jgi:hypothetical protein
MDLETFKNSELVDQYNKASTYLGEKPITKFADRKTAIRRTREQLIKFVKSIDEKLAADVEAGTTTVEAAVQDVVKRLPTKTKTKVKKAKVEPTEKKVRGPHQKHFVFKPLDEIRAPKDTTLRGRAVQLLKKGATLEQVQDLVREFDKDRKKTEKNVDRRAYELVRLVHYYLGYGLKQENGKIIAYGA